MRAVYIYCDDTDVDDVLWDATTSDLAPGLDPLRACVAGYIEAVYLAPGVVMFINEEGKILGLPHNPLATRLLAGTHYEGNTIEGQAIIVGYDGDGENIALTEQQVGEILERLDTRR